MDTELYEYKHSIAYLIDTAYAIQYALDEDMAPESDVAKLDYYLDLIATQQGEN